MYRFWMLYVRIRQSTWGVFKWRFAYWLDECCEDACWVELVKWAMGFRSTKETFWPWWGYPNGAWREQICSVEEGSYCGKCERTGRLGWERDDGPLIIFAEEKDG